MYCDSEVRLNYHNMNAAEMNHHCGIDSWPTHSRIIHASSPQPEGPCLSMPMRCFLILSTPGDFKLLSQPRGPV